MSCKIQQFVCSDCVTYAKSRINFNHINTFNNVKYQYNFSFLSEWLKANPEIPKGEILQAIGAKANNRFKAWVRCEGPMPVISMLRLCNAFQIPLSAFFRDADAGTDGAVVPGMPTPNDILEPVQGYADNTDDRQHGERSILNPLNVKVTPSVVPGVAAKTIKVDDTQQQSATADNISDDCFLKAREIILGKTEIQHTVVEESPKFYQRNGNQYFQQIFYGAPGTGKSYIINRDTAGEDVIRTTFHPDTDYSTFVGAYKPTTIEEEVMTVTGTKAVPVENADGTHRKESKIVYEFVQQSFLQAYVAAWKKYAETQDGEPRKQFLVIEEINRGNCAQIFGDLFQLLDRNAQGFSDYPITADADMKRQLKKAFAGLTLADGDSINAMYNGRNVCQEVLEGDILLLPNNLYIWATMNTSDQSLFPIDSAFKRRWDWQYMPISNANLNWTIEVNGNKYEWWQFLEQINEKIGSLTNSEDKKLGYFFCKADNEGVITAETFVSKVIFYLWNDVFKDYEFSDTIFDDGNGGKLTFDKFYMANGNVNEEKIRMFLKNIGMMPIEEAIEDVDDDSVNTNGKTIPKYSINGSSEQFSTPNAVRYIIENYAKQNENISVDEMIQLWNGIAERNNLLVPTWQPSPNDNQPFANKRRVKIEWGACSAWLITGWTENLFKKFIQNVKQQLDINIDRVN